MTSKKNYEEIDLKNKLINYLITVDDQELRNSLMDALDTYSPPDNVIRPIIFGDNEKNPGTLTWYEMEVHPYETFTNQIKEMRENIPREPSSMLIKMNFSYAVTLMESCLGSMLKSVIFSKDHYLNNAIRNIKELKEIKLTLIDLKSNKNIISDTVTSTLSGILYHNIEKIVPIYACVLGCTPPKEIREKIGVIIKIVSNRHHIVHRNGYNLEGKMLNLTPEILEATLINITEFVQEIHNFINNSEKNQPS